ncbi:MAG TPA: putative sulfate exporter family transporter [Polyangiaceae bacterium]|nr:putative sulfate exporter family transporter [Polyangiaceae bacterium]
MRRPQWVPALPDLRGLGLALAVGSASLALTRALPPSPLLSDVLVALVLGAVILNTPLRRAIRLALPGPDREPDEYAPGLRYTGKWVLRLAIVLMGFKVQTGLFARGELVLVAGVTLAALPSTFFLAHGLGATLNVRRPMADLLAAGTMICGASAVNAVAPVARAHRDEQATAIAVISLFSITALLVFRPIAMAVGLDPSVAGLWSGLAVNDLSSAIAVGTQMGGTGGVMAAAAKSFRVLLLAPALVVLSLLRRDAGPVNVRKSAFDTLPGFLVGYVALAVTRAVADRLVLHHPTYGAVLTADRLLVDLCMATVSAGMGLHLSLGQLLASSPRALLVGGGASVWMASVTLAMLAGEARGSHATATLIGGVALAVGWASYRGGNRAEVQERLLARRFESGAPLSLGEARQLLDRVERAGPLDDPFLRRVMTQLHPTIGELIPIRDSPLPHGEGCRWITYWEGKSGWALVAIARDPGAATPIHAHPHRMLGKAIEGVLEELRFQEVGAGEIELFSRAVLGHEELVEADGLSALHVVRAVGRRAAIDLQLRGPEMGRPGRLLVARPPVDVLTLAVGDRLQVTEESDSRPGHGGEGAGVGRVSVASQSL